MRNANQKPLEHCARRTPNGIRAFVVLLGLIGTAFLIVAGLRLAATAPGAAQSAAQEFVHTAGREVLTDIRRVVLPAIDRGRLVAENPAIAQALKNVDQEALTHLCNKAMRASTEVDAIAIFDRDGAIVAINTIYADGDAIAPDRVNRVMTRDYSKRDIIKKCVNNEARQEILEFQTGCDITPAFFDSSGLSVAHSVPVFDDRGIQVGVVSTRIRFDRISNLLRGYEIAGGAGRLDLVTDAGGYFDESINAGAIPAPMSRDTLAAIVSTLVRGETSQVMFDHGDQSLGLFRAAGMQTLDGGGIQVMVTVPNQWLLHEARLKRFVAAGMPGAIGLLIIGTAALVLALAQGALRRQQLSGAVSELEGFFGTTPDLLCMLDRQSRFLKLNSSWKTVLHRNPEELLGQSFVNCFHPDDRESTAQMLEILFEGRAIEGTINRIRPPQGDDRHLEWRAQSANGIVYAAGRDVTDRVRQQRQLASLEERLRLFIEHTPAAVAMFDRRMHYLMASEGWYDQYGLTDKNINGKSHYEIFPTIPARWKELHQRALAGETLRADRDFFEHEDGEKVWVRWHLRPWYTAERRIGGIIMFTEVIGKQIKHEQKLHRARLLAESANRAKSEFLANMSHEIRTPMTAILGFADTLLDPDLSQPERTSTIQTIRRNGEHLLQIINDILDISKIEAGKLEVEAIQCSPWQIASDVHALMSVRAQAKQLSLSVESDGPIPCTITSDPTRLRQVLVNLVGNAIKFSQSGEVRLIVRFAESGSADEGATANMPMLEFDIVDSGIGISPEQLSNLFKPFSQADGSTTRNFGGTGLGLIISKRLANLLDGDVTVDSELGKGSTFRVRIATGPLDGVEFIEGPVDPAHKRISGAHAASSTTSRIDCRILLAEDSPDSQKLISLVLTKAGAHVTSVDNGRKAVNACMEALEHDVPFDIVLMDMQMPIMDGYEATTLLRNHGYAGPIVALTAHAMGGDRRKCIDAGCNDYATKPIVREDLIRQIQRWVTERKRMGARPGIALDSHLHGGGM